MRKGGYHLWLPQPENSESHPPHAGQCAVPVLACSTCAPGPAECSPGEMCSWPKMNQQETPEGSQGIPSLLPVASQVGKDSHMSSMGMCWNGSSWVLSPKNHQPESFQKHSCSRFFTAPPPFLVLRIFPRLSQVSLTVCH